MQVPETTLGAAQIVNPAFERGLLHAMTQGLQAIANLLEVFAQRMQFDIAGIGREPAGKQDATAAAGLQPFRPPFHEGQLTKAAVPALPAPVIQLSDKLAGAFRSELCQEQLPGLALLPFQPMQERSAPLSFPGLQPFQEPLRKVLSQDVGIPAAAGRPRQCGDPRALQPRRQLQGGPELGRATIAAAAG
jgi:hypothetical protein